MDVRTALIAGTAFAGVLIAGAVAAPRGGGSDSAGVSGGTGQPVATNVVQSPQDSLVSLPSGSSGEREHERDHDDDDHDEDDD